MIPSKVTLAETANKLPKDAKTVFDLGGWVALGAYTNIKPGVYRCPDDRFAIRHSITSNGDHMGICMCAGRGFVRLG